MSVYKGVGVSFGIANTTASLNSVSGALQTRDMKKESDVDIVRDGGGNTIEKTYYDIKKTGTFAYIQTNGTADGNITVTIPNVGDVLTVTDSKFTDVAGTNWLIDDIDTAGSNTTALKVTLKLTAYPLITS